ncbi:5-formyltetrahydrofolate cyclo-ligase [Peptoniphilus stercorisuis]|uniref:5-formyltetrahydrofolate cyclo-ligase n=1 Tax=Peptoniphilus stercorisuis TaxID=1436965 RepID=A0ABS4KDX4_9FIRM|nr:5-formyltetrahydrofolate cyclo-ligase [Peptoniphilus stercorisuis]MBP2025968.1 5-formyltetrahydrofolate cyclo-ligase [Peptoniphilus stercorisuis]
MGKKELRDEILKRRNLLSYEEVQVCSNLIEENLYSLELFKNANNIFIFVSYNKEVNTHNIIKNSLKLNKEVYVPVVDPKTKTMKASRLRDFSNLKENYMKILEPSSEYLDFIDPDIIDLAIVPGLLFNKEGYRIGYGGGFYDKFFKSLKRDIKKLGIGYDFQFTTGNTWQENFDIPVNYFLSEKKFYIL